MTTLQTEHIIVDADLYLAIDIYESIDTFHIESSDWRNRLGQLCWCEILIGQIIRHSNDHKLLMHKIWCHKKKVQVKTEKTII